MNTEAYAVVSLKVICCKLKPHWTWCFHQELTYSEVPGISENLRLHLPTACHNVFREFMTFHIQNAVYGAPWSLSETRRVSLRGLSGFSPLPPAVHKALDMGVGIKETKKRSLDFL